IVEVLIAGNGGRGLLAGGAVGRMMMVIEPQMHRIDALPVLPRLANESFGIRYMKARSAAGPCRRAWSKARPAHTSPADSAWPTRRTEPQLSRRKTKETARGRRVRSMSIDSGRWSISGTSVSDTRTCEGECSQNALPAG